MFRILSTKKLALNQKELLLNAGIALVEYAAIKIDFADFQLPENKINNAIFTSQNAVRAISGKKEVKIENCFCVGNKTSAMLSAKGFHIAGKAQSSRELSEFIIENHNTEDFIFFCGNKRRDELPDILEKKGISLMEVEVYRTRLNSKKIEGKFDGIMFFSPSAVKSYVLENALETTAFCIGETTAAEAGKYNIEVVTASQPGIENVIAKAIGHLKQKKNDQPGADLKNKSI
ncbi:uroporphyrinogen-III synthase [Christiangramia salexigens]|uniref:Uroporphyrinogen-III synthase n=1 Tax=Christiangramia salexigens TaxID=1913577 RepID=A0A1L3J6U1_9FLAO|nr:uroporphyrinogen-III synthase [Christiangramia salexigens]APG60862.1 uroporphyrinogen-III synthase [Christiangramia salexigens]